ncbi:hypothetical protein [Rhodanobacter lindaniclasticus]
MAQHAQEMLRVRLPRLPLQGVAVERFGHVQLACAMRRNGLLQRGSHTFGHGR